MLEYATKSVKAKDSLATPTSMSGGAALVRLLTVVRERMNQTARYIEYRRPSLPKVSIDDKGGISFSFINRYENGFTGFVKDMTRDDNPNRLTLSTALPPLDDDSKSGALALELKNSLISSLQAMVTDGFTFANKTA
jgi:hypothetical protein